MDAVANLASQAKFSHVLLKIADGTSPYNVIDGQDWAAYLTRSLHDRAIQALGWHYVYGYDPLGEANIAIQRVTELGLDGYVIDAEAPYKEPGRDEDARQFMDALRAALPTFPIVLSSYRYPSYHPQFPFQAFLEKCDYNMPQVYWVLAHNPADQLVRSVREFQGITPFRPIIPTGAAYLEGGWSPTDIEVNEFLRAAQNLDLSAANFWEWANCRKNLPAVWSAIYDYNWPPDDSNLDIVQRYIAALNSHDPQRALALYNPEAVHVTGMRTVQGLEAIRLWYQDLFDKLLPNAIFTLTGYTSDLGSRQLTWQAFSDSGNVENGSDALGLIGGKITYHYTYFTVTPSRL